ncbi:MAG: IclR family transcriptional regulator [Rhizobiaceae bacterium]
MRTVDKALKLLDYFNDRRSEIGLSELARLAEIDKATTHRMVTVLANHGFLEQHPDTRAYRLGAGILRLARLREACFPVEVIVNPVLRRIADQTGETAHISLLAGRQLMTVGSAEPDRGNRVHIEPGLILPFHATASGIAFMAFAAPEFVDKILSRKLKAFTDATDCDPVSIRNRLSACRETGFGISDEGFQTEICSTAAPLFDANGIANGAVTIATPTSRMNASARRSIAESVIEASYEISRGLGGEPSEMFKSVARKTAA